MSSKTYECSSATSKDDIPVMRNNQDAIFKVIGPLRGVSLSRWRFWNTASKIGVLKSPVSNDTEAVVKQTTDM